MEAEIEEAHLKAKEEMMQGIQMAKEVAQKELSDQKTRYEERIKALENELVHKTPFIFFNLQVKNHFTNLLKTVHWFWFKIIDIWKTKTF